MTTRGRKSSIKLDSSSSQLNMPMFHFNPSTECIQTIANFAKEHRNENNKAFKLSWQQSPEIENTIKNETDRLRQSGYEGDIVEKLYSSARYYYRKKALAEEKETTPPSKSPRKTHEPANRELLEQMNADVLSRTNERPSAAYNNYKQIYNISDEDDAKMKKLYKNRFFMVRKKLANL